MSTRLLRARFFLMGALLAACLASPIRVTMADPAACAAAVARAAAAQAEMEAACSGPYGYQSGACQLAIQEAGAATVFAAAQCAQ